MNKIRLKLLLFIFINILNAEEVIVKFVYLFDTSATFKRGPALSQSLNKAEEFFAEMIDIRGFNPSSHNISLIDDKSIKIGGWNKCKEIIVKKDGSFIKTADRIKDKEIFKKCLDNVDNESEAPLTDISGAFVDAAEAFQSKNLKGKGILIFSDLKEEGSPYTNFTPDLKGVSVYVIYEYPNEKKKKPDPVEMEKNKAKLKQYLIRSGVQEKDIEIKRLTSISSVNEIISFFISSFKN